MGSLILPYPALPNQFLFQYKGGGGPGAGGAQGFLCLRVFLPVLALWFPGAPVKCTSQAFVGAEATGQWSAVFVSSFTVGIVNHFRLQPRIVYEAVMYGL